MDDTAITFSSLDPSQKNTFKSIVRDEDNLQIVYGPPGTGKSQLVVSLLERLASENKKVLFVSQNTEALKVIERMIKRTELAIGYPIDNKYLSLIDFCLMLHNPTHRYLKYLREQYSKINGKQLPDLYVNDEPETVQYPLQYTALDHNVNYNIDSTILGFDELVSYYIKYVKHAMAPESIREFEKINTRAVFTELDTYSNKSHFAEFNKPRRELILLSTKNSNIVLPDIREQIKNIQEALNYEFINQFTVKCDMDIVDYLVLLQKYCASIKYLDVYRIAIEQKNINELSESLKCYVDDLQTSNEKLHSIDKNIENIVDKSDVKIYIPENLKKQIILNNESIAIAEKDYDELISDASRVAELIKIIIDEAPDVKYASINDLLIGLVKEIKTVYNETIEGGGDTIYSLTSKEVDLLNNELEKFYSQNPVKRKLGGIPKTFKELLNFDNSKQLDFYRDDLAPILNTIRDVICIDGSSIRNFLTIASNSNSVELSKLGVKKSKDLDTIKNRLVPVYELFYIINKKHASSSFKLEFKDVLDWYESFNYGVKALNVLRQDETNKKAFLTMGLKQFIYNANNAIAVRDFQSEKDIILKEQKELRQNSFEETQKWLLGINDAEIYSSRAREIYEFIEKNLTYINSLISNISLPDNNIEISANIAALIDLLNSINQLDIFSDFFFELQKDKNLNDWLNGISVLLTYNNDSEIVDFIQHNKSINNIKRSFGSLNEKYIDDILSNDISFDLFASRVVNVLVSETFGRASLASKKHVTTGSIIDSYDRYLKSRKAQIYRDNLKTTYSNSLNAMRELSKQSTMQLGGSSTMDKFRFNTVTIADAFPIICATPKEVSKYIAAEKGVFDYVIFDEASQLLPGQAIPSIYRSKKTVIIGDPHQMPPSLNASIGLTEQSDDDYDDLGESILDLVRKQPQKQHHLKVHYRSKYNKLFEPSRTAIYSDDGIEPIFEAELAAGAPIDIVENLGNEQDEYGYDNNFRKICQSIEEYMEENSTSTFCVLFTTGQKLTEFKNFLAQLGDEIFKSVADLYNTEKILLSTVTNCQGIEGAYTIIYMHYYVAPGAMWFFKETAGAYKRLNVSITRQREGLKLLLANPKSKWVQTCEEKLSNNTTGPNARKSAELMKSLLKNAGEVTDTTYLDRELGHKVNSFDSPLTQHLYEKLTDHYSGKLGKSIKIYSEVGWNLLIPNGDGISSNERNVGFRLDLGIFSMKQKKFVLGIEMDGAMYHSGYDKEQSDYNRQVVLEDKGWKLYRIWSTNWLDDTEREFNRLVHVIDKNLGEDA